VQKEKAHDTICKADNGTVARRDPIKAALKHWQRSVNQSAHPMLKFVVWSLPTGMRAS
jgi:hypothetical protein